MIGQTKRVAPALAALVLLTAAPAPAAGPETLRDGAHLIDDAGRARVERAAAAALANGIGLGFLTVDAEPALAGALDAAASEVPAQWGGRWLVVGVAWQAGAFAEMDFRTGPSLGWAKLDPIGVMVAGLDALRAGDVVAGFEGMAGKVARYHRVGDLSRYDVMVFLSAVAALVGVVLGQVRRLMALVRSRPGVAWAFVFLCLAPVAWLLSEVVNQAQAAAGSGQVAMVIAAVLGGLLSLSRFSWRGVVAAFVWVFVVSPVLLIPTLTPEQDWDGVPDETLLWRHLLIASVGLVPGLAFWAWRRRRAGVPLYQEEA